MTTPGANKVRIPSARFVAVVSSPSELARALALQEPPDFFELRLDALYPVLPEIAAHFGRLRAPLIITARDPAEGGAHELSGEIRRGLLLRFLPRAAALDVELRSAPRMAGILQMAKARNIQRIISIHMLRETPSLARLEQLSRAAEALAPDILKIAIRTETADEWERLATFFQRASMRLPVSAMGIGKFGRTSRIALAQQGSALNYVHLGSARLEGQLSLVELRQILRGR